ncbi:hypothetical protein DH2020_004352 [Rehmannia glutinosa]|uniref:RNA-binding S4 domain-containing protein n=1 Tax=Rehmannia glutinosa TaxID=99300 RepID=A0ABR0XP59_REHGL
MDLFYATKTLGASSRSIRSLSHNNANSSGSMVKQHYRCGGERFGLLDESQNKLDYVLALTMENFLERRLLTLVFKACMAKSIHHARVLIRQRHIRVRRQVVNVPSFMGKVDTQKYIDFSLTSPFDGGHSGRVKRKNQKAAAKKASGGDGDEEDKE